MFAKLRTEGTCFALALVTFVVLIILLGLGAFQDARASTPPTVYTHIQLTWTAPTTGCTSPAPAVCDNVALTPAVIAYDVFYALAPITTVPATPSATVDGATLKANLYPSAPQGSTFYLYVRARNGALGDAAHTGALTQAVTIQAGTVVAQDTTPGVPGSPAATISFTTTPPPS